jgi:type IV pilus assembly protein PilY1
MYAIKDDNATATLVNPRTYSATAPIMVQQTITPNGGVRTGSNNPVDFSVDRGWFVDFPDTGERVNIDSKLVQGALLAPTLVPSNTACSPGGYGWLNFFDYATGWPITDGTGVGTAGTNTNVSVKYDATIVGMNILYIGGEPVVEVVTSDNPTPTVDTTVVIKPATSNFTGNRMQWRELIP